MSQLRKYTDWTTWLRGLAGASVGGGANAVTIMVIKPEDFNFATGWPNLWKFCLVSMLVSLALYLKQSPIPAEITEIQNEDIDPVPPKPDLPVHSPGSSGSSSDRLPDKGP
jgi:hypothetical protein